MSGVILDTAQVALFPIEFHFKAFDLYKRMRDLLDESGDTLRVDPTFDMGGPDDYVRVSGLLKQDKNVELQISPAKIGIFWRNRESSPTFELNAETMISIVRKVVNSAIGESSTFQRVGYIRTIFKVLDKPMDIIDKLIDKPSLHVGLTDLQMTLTYDFTEADVKDLVDNTVNYNKYVRIGKGQASVLGNKPAVLLEYDLNTRQNSQQANKVNWNLDKVCAFLSVVSAYKDKNDIFLEFFQ